MSAYKRNPEEIKRLFEESKVAADKLHRRYTQGAKLTGYIRDRLEANEPYWVTLADCSPEDPDMDMTIASGEAFLRSYKQQLNYLYGQLSDQSASLTTLASSGSTFDANTASLCDVIPIFQGKELEHQPCPFIEQGDYSSRERQLEKLDPSLARTYSQVWEALHGTRSDPERTALYLMRQTYDHFFYVLAPDDKVRQSKVWKEKEGDKPELVTRAERIEYAALTHIKDEGWAKLMSSSAKPILKVYSELNQAHKRGELNPTKARRAVLAMDKVISDWLDALDL
jgi:hypothetical protein